jgi:DNA-binding CsgD family transcriptional regulator
MFHQLIANRNEMIVKMWEEGLSRQFIADAFGISRKQVRKIVNRTYKVNVEVTLE